jgi:regulator of sigma D
VDELQSERKQVWALFCQIAEMKPFNAVDDVTPVLMQFSEILVDYVSLGHFGLFERALSGTERRGNILELVKRIYPRYSETTDSVIAFNDCYDDTRKVRDLKDLEKHLSQLGEQLAKRMELEDKVCAVLLRK